MLKKLRKLKSEEHGQALVFFVGIFAILLAVMAFVVDVGSVYVEKAKLQNAVDAAALAGAYDLTGGDDVIAETIARGSANNYFDSNGYEDVIPIIDPEANSVKVSAIKNVNYTFAQIIGLSSANVKASATASISPADGVTGVIPVGVVQQIFNIGQEYTLKEGGGDGANGNFGGLDFGSLTSFVNSSFKKGGAALFQDLVTEGYDQPIFVGEKVDTEPGAMSGKSFTENKIAFIPLVDSMDVEGKKELTIVGFAAFKVKNYYEEKTEIDGKTVKKGVIVGTFEYDVAASSVAGTYPDSGLRNVRLTE
ncbi:Tad domain-containing protein [uncultured Trichococcus sp.]|uniref:Tad domain-containing protein n=1 Tax=uncultured Trichococcus sp. TaxID=189665 RepID=UPI0029C97E40|nr:Tad domain-containing protein [uncultured Trichococcus sp.]